MYKNINENLIKKLIITIMNVIIHLTALITTIYILGILDIIIIRKHN